MGEHLTVPATGACATTIDFNGALAILAAAEDRTRGQMFHSQKSD